MKVLPVFLGLICAVLAVALLMTKRSDDAQHTSDVETIAGYSNKLFSAQTEIDICKGTIITFSNRLDVSESATLTFSNQLTEAQSSLAATTEQIDGLKQQLKKSESENQVLNRNITELTGQIAGLTNQIISAQAGVEQANENYALLENRFRRDVAERLVVERKFNNIAELQAQLEYLKWNPAGEISASTIYAGLDVVVKSNICYVIAPN